MANLISQADTKLVAPPIQNPWANAIVGTLDLAIVVNDRVDTTNKKMADILEIIFLIR